jgi:flagellar biosynthesis protein FlhF
MNVQKFLAHSSREALRQVRDVIGPDAVILSNRTVEGGVEILALGHEEMASLAAPAEARKALPEIAPVARREEDAQPGTQAANLAALLNRAPEPAAAAPAVSSQELNEVMSEIRSMRGMLEAQLAGLAWGALQKREPMKAVVMREMLAAGFSASLARYLTEKLQDGDSREAGMHWIKTVLARNLATIDNENEILEQGGVYALVGPTGVGKTTTTAKLAARCVMRHGAGKLALITTDGYRIGGYEQLRIYGKILGVMVHSVKDEADLKIALDELKGKHMVLIDTVGVSQRDQMVAQQVAMLAGAGSGVGTEVKRLLCLNATSTGETLNEVIRAYQGDGLAGCIMTKLDEAATIGSALDALIRHKLRLYYVANGQRVPEDLHLANRQYLIDRAFKLKRETEPFTYQNAELPLVVANAAHAMNDPSLREVSLV